MVGSAESKKILITGASGFIGRATLEALVHDDLSEHVYCISRSAHKNTSQVTWL